MFTRFIVAALAVAALTAGAGTTFENEFVTLGFDDLGRIASIRERSSGRELVAEPSPMVNVRLKDGRCFDAETFSAKENALVYDFPAAPGSAVLEVVPFEGGWTFTVKELSVRDVAAFQFARVMPACVKYPGYFVNGFSDDESAVVLRAYELETEMYANGSLGLKSYASRSGVDPREDSLGLRLVCEMPGKGFTGLRGGLVAGPRGRIPAMLRAMTSAAGAPHTDFGGAWSLGGEGARRSYLFSDLAAAKVDDWIDLARRSGFETVHFHAWWEWLGHYYPNRKFFPGGLDELKRTVGKVHAAGLTAGMHTLSGSIDPEFDPWVRTAANSNLLAVVSYTLARPLSADADELYVNELPSDRHEFVHAYFSSGNTLRIGSELVNYKALSREPPYRFTGLERGAFGTEPGSHPAGEACHYLRQRYLAFYPDPDTPLLGELAACISNVYSGCGFDQIYLDGSEGSGTRYATDRTRHALFSAIDQRRGPVMMEGSCQGPHNWWFHGRYGARDIPYLGSKRFHDAHIRDVIENGVKANFLAPQFGWWSPRLPADGLRGHFPDEMEYFAGKNAGWDAPSSVLGADVSKGPLPFGQLRQMTLFGWYERPRIARAFRSEVLAAFRKERAEFRLRQDADGVWRVCPVEVSVHRVTDLHSREWKLGCGKAVPAAVRIEALRTPDDAGWEKAETLVPGKWLGVFSATSTVCRSFAFAPPAYFDLKGRTGFGVKVKGDGSGALLNIQFCGTPQFGSSLSEHYVKLDFAGWRYFSFLDRERDSAQAADHEWPYDITDRVCGTLLDYSHLGSVDFWLNDVPAGGASVEISDLRLLAERAFPLRDGTLTVNGVEHRLPFALAAGEYAEFEDGAWIRYSESGEPLERRPAPPIGLAAGENRLGFAGGRAEVTVFAFGDRSSAFVEPLATEMRRRLAFEACEPVRFAPALGFDALPQIAVRPGETAAVRIAVRGALADSAAVLENAAGDRVLVKLPCTTAPLSGAWRLKPLDTAADVVLDIVKRYDQPSRR